MTSEPPPRRTGRERVEFREGTTGPRRDDARSAPAAVEVLSVDAEGPPPALSTADGTSVTTVRSAAAAREHLAVAGAVDCVVSEYDLPDGDGLALLDAVRDHYPDLPFVLYTDAGSEAVASEAVGMGVTDYLPKGVGVDRLRERVARAVEPAGGDGESAGGDEGTGGTATGSAVTGDRLREVTAALPDVAFVVDERGRHLEVLSGPTGREFESLDRTDLVGARIHDVFPASKADRFLDHVRTTLKTGEVETMEYTIETPAGERWYEGRTAPLGERIDGREAVVWVARDVTERRRNERELAARRDELERLTRINSLIYAIVQSLAESTSREEIERTVCQRLARSEFYQFAWVGGPWVTEERTNPSVVEGVDHAAVERLVEATSARSGDENAFVRVVTNDESVVAPDLTDSDVVSERERDIMLDLGMSSAALIPLSHGTTNYGVLAISGARAGTFGDREVTALETLGGIVSFAIDAVRNRNLLLSDTAIELEFRVDGQRPEFARLSGELDARFRLEGVVPLSEDRLLEYVAVEGVSPAVVVDELDGFDATDDYRVVTDDGDEGLLELELAWSGVRQLLKAGTVVTEVVAEDGVAEYVAEASPDADVRSIVDAFRTAFPEAELTSKQEVDRPVHTGTEFRRTLDSELTDKQGTALKTAYFAGYYQYPRTSSGQQVADSLGVSSPTFHQHLRAAQRKLVETYLDQ